MSARVKSTCISTDRLPKRIRSLPRIGLRQWSQRTKLRFCAIHAAPPLSRNVPNLARTIGGASACVSPKLA